MQTEKTKGERCFLRSQRQADTLSSPPKPTGFLGGEDEWLCRTTQARRIGYDKLKDSSYSPQLGQRIALETEESDTIMVRPRKWKDTVFEDDGMRIQEFDGHQRTHLQGVRYVNYGIIYRRYVRI